MPQSDTKHEHAHKIGRLGYLAYGLLQLVLALLILRIAWSTPSGDASTSGAIASVAQQPAGRVLVWVVALGLLMLACWQAYVGIRSDKGKWDKAGAMISAIAYAAVSFIAFRFALDSSQQSNSNQQSEQATATILGLPGGRWLVGLVAVVIIGVGLYHAYEGLTDEFVEDLHGDATRGSSGTLVLWLGRVGYLTRGVAYVTVGGLFVTAAVTADKDKAGGLDAALGTLKQQPFGPALLTSIAVGFAAYGLFCFARARYETE